MESDGKSGVDASDVDLRDLGDFEDLKESRQMNYL